MGKRLLDPGVLPRVVNEYVSVVLLVAARDEPAVRRGARRELIKITGDRFWGPNPSDSRLCVRHAEGVKGIFIRGSGSRQRQYAELLAAQRPPSFAKSSLYTGRSVCRSGEASGGERQARAARRRAPYLDA